MSWGDNGCAVQHTLELQRNMASAERAARLRIGMECGKGTRGYQNLDVPKVMLLSQGW